MDKKEAYKSIFQDTLLGLVIGWGGFNALLPNLLESIGEVNNLGSFIALRIFSVVYFLSPLLIFITFWWVKGSRLYFNRLCNIKYDTRRRYNLYLIITLFLKVFPLILFLNDQFFIYPAIHRLLNFFSFFEFICWYYGIIAVVELSYFTLSTIVHIEENEAVLLRFFTANVMVFSLNVLLGIGVMSFIEPWAIYKYNFVYEIIGVAMLYAVVAFALYLFKFKKGRTLTVFKKFYLGVISFVFLIACFPALSFNPWVGVITLTLLWLLFLIRLVYVVYVKGESFKAHFSVLIGLTGFVFTLMVLLWYFVSSSTLRANQHYLTNRVVAASKISKIKIFPFYVLNDEEDTKGIFRNGRAVSNFKALDMPTRLKMAHAIHKQNHLWVAYTKSNGAAIFKGNNTITLGLSENDSIKIYLDSLDQERLNVQSMYFSSYKKALKEFEKAGSSTFDFQNNYVKIHFSEHDSIGQFYDNIYRGIHYSLIKKHLNKIDIEIASKSFAGVTEYFHPINYYTKTLRHYSDQYKKAKRIEALIKEAQLLDATVFDSTRFGDNPKSTMRKDFNTLIHNKKQSIIQGKIKQQLIRMTEWRNLDTANFSCDEEFVEIFPKYRLLKGRQYLERYQRAQEIFRAYLSDAQRVGVYIFVVFMLTLGFLYWYHVTNKDETPSSREEEEDTSNPLQTATSFLNISFLVIVVLFINISRPIRPEHINPEKPYWMMNMENWYKASILTDFTESGPKDKQELLIQEDLSEGTE